MIDLAPRSLELFYVMKHKFSGYSIWLEPEQTSPLNDEVKRLAYECNSRIDGSAHTFAPHCTLLYNLTLEDEVQGVRLLHEARHDFRKVLAKGCNSLEKEGVVLEEFSKEKLKVCPTHFFYFPYPKSADNGRGFGCVIVMLILESSQLLCKLQHIVARIFPSDERHGEGAKFQPHMALCYAAEEHSSFLRDEYSRLSSENSPSSKTLLMPFCGKYVSLWKTEGEIHEWKLVAKIEL